MYDIFFFDILYLFYVQEKIASVKCKSRLVPSGNQI